MKFSVAASAPNPIAFGIPVSQQIIPAIVPTPRLISETINRIVRQPGFDFVKDLERRQTRVAACECHHEATPQVRPFRNDQKQHDEKEKKARDWRQQDGDRRRNPGNSGDRDRDFIRARGFANGCAETPPRRDQTVEYVQLFLQRRDHARQAIREFRHSREDQQDYESDYQRHTGHHEQRYKRARNVQPFESPSRRTQHDADHESRHDGQHHLARGVENEAGRDCGKDRQRPGRDFPQRDFWVGIFSSATSTASGRRPSPIIPPLRRAGGSSGRRRNKYGAILIPRPAIVELRRAAK